MKVLLRSLSIAGFCFSTMTSAGSMGYPGEPDAPVIQNGCSKVVTLSLGPAWYSMGEVPVTNNPPLYQNIYFPEKVSGTVGSGEIFFGLARPLNYQISGQLGLAVGYSGDATQKGQLYIYQPVSDFGKYFYKVSNTRISLKGKMLAAWPYVIKPYISGSTGVGFNRSFNYGYTTPPFAMPYSNRPYYANNTVVAFSWTAGIGIQGNLNDHWQVGVGYEFADWGKNNFKQLLVKNPNEYYIGLHSNSLYTNSVQFSLSYSFLDTTGY